MQNWFDTKRKRERRSYDEKLYEQVANEIFEGLQRPGIWAKALADSKGDEALTRSLYIKYRVQALKDEHENLWEANLRDDRLREEEKLRAEEKLREEIKLRKEEKLRERARLKTRQQIKEAQERANEFYPPKSVFEDVLNGVFVLGGIFLAVSVVVVVIALVFDIVSQVGV